MQRFLLLLLAGLFACNEPVQQVPKRHLSWHGYGGGADQSKFVVQNQITKENVGQLEIAWTYSTGDQRAYNINPTIVDSVMYVMARNNSLVALDATSGRELWIHAGLNGMSRRGFSYWENEDRSDRRIIFALNNTLQAIDAQTGLSILSFGKNGIVDLRQGMDIDPDKIMRISPSTPGRIFEDLIILGSSPGESYLSSPGHIRAFNVITGELAWIFHTIPLPGEFGYETWPKDAYKYVGGVNCWGEITVDQENGMAFVPLGSPTYDYYGADRKGANLFGNCLLALDARTGKRIWHFQTVHHDMWDYDLVSAPQLITVNHEGKDIDAVALATKQGFMFAFERKTGEPLWPIEERPVPPSDVPGEEAWPTQPFPTVLPPFNRQTVTEDDISDIFLSEEEYAAWKERIAKAPKGLFTPISTVETIAMPGATGGANWGNSASNPDRGRVYILSQEYPSFYKLEPRPPAMSASLRRFIATREAIGRGEVVYKKHCQLCHGKDLAGTDLGPSLLSIADRLSLPFLQQTVQYGTGRMPAVQHIGENEIADILALLQDRSTGSSDEKEGEEKAAQSGPVVASGGAPGEDEITYNRSFNRAGRAYPEGVEVPEQRYYTGYGLGFPYIVKPPWATITAYDMNKGTIMWTQPLGEDEEAVAKGFRNTGVPNGSQRNGMVITSNGLVFATVTNGRIYAYDAETGKILWTGRTSMGIGSMPAMYEVGGRVYLAITATSTLPGGWNLSDEEKNAIQKEEGERAYVVFALPNPQ